MSWGLTPWTSAEDTSSVTRLRRPFPEDGRRPTAAYPQRDVAPASKPGSRHAPRLRAKRRLPTVVLGREQATPLPASRRRDSVAVRLARSVVLSADDALPPPRPH